MHGRRILFNLFFIVLVAGVAPFAARLQAQAISGDLVGRVIDASGAIVPNVSVTATNTATDVQSVGAHQRGRRVSDFESSAGQLQRLGRGVGLQHFRA